MLAAATLASCADPTPGPANQAAEVVESPVVASNDATPTPTPAATNDEADQCGAADHQWLVGENRSRIPEEPAGANWRITCTGCTVTQDYSPQRMNIFFNEETEIIASVTCG